MTENKAQKTAIRERMARTGEPYSVARRAVLSGQQPPAGATGPWPKWIPKPWNEEVPGSRPWDEEIPEGRPWDEEIPEDSFAGAQPWLAHEIAGQAQEWAAEFPGHPGHPRRHRVRMLHRPGTERG